MRFHNLIVLILLFSLTSQLSAQDLDHYIDNLDQIHLEQDDLRMEFHLLDRDKTRNIKDEDKWYYWFDGKRVITTEGDFDDQLLHGTFTAFYSNNQLHSKGKFKKGLRIGKWKFWASDGRLIRIERYTYGVLNNTRYLLEEDKERFQKDLEKQQQLDEKKRQKELEEEDAE